MSTNIEKEGGECTIVILFLRGLDICLVDDGAVGSSVPAPPRDRALLRDVFVVEEISFRSGLGWIGAFSPLREAEVGVFVPPARESLLRGERLTLEDIIVQYLRYLS